MIRLLTNREIYTEVIQRGIPSVQQRLWIATADIKDLHVESRGVMRPFLGVLSDILQRGVEIRLIHAKEPGPNFRKDFDRYPILAESLERMLCPRVHFKCVIMDGRLAYLGSANLTGAGMGAKSEHRRNFENGIYTNDPTLIESLEEQFDSVWRGNFCPSCGRRAYCGDCPLD